MNTSVERRINIFLVPYHMPTRLADGLGLGSILFLGNSPLIPVPPHLLIDLSIVNFMC